MHYDPRDHGHEDPPPPRWPDYLIATLLVLLLAGIVHGCAQAQT